MKISITEYDNEFHLDMYAETPADAALLVRLALNGKNGSADISTYAFKSEIQSLLSIQKYTKCIQEIKRK